MFTSLLLAKNEKCPVSRFKRHSRPHQLKGYFHKFFDFVAIHEIAQLSRAGWELDILNKLFYVEKAFLSRDRR